MHQNKTKRLYETKDRNFYLLIIIIAIFGLFLRWHDVGKHQSQNDVLIYLYDNILVSIIIWLKN